MMVCLFWVFLLCYLSHADKEGGLERYAYILASQGMLPGNTVSSGIGAGIKTGNSLPLSAIPVGTALHNVEMNPGKGGQLARSAGTSARLVSKGNLPHSSAQLDMCSPKNCGSGFNSACLALQLSDDGTKQCTSCMQPVPAPHLSQEVCSRYCLIQPVPSCITLLVLCTSALWQQVNASV